MSQSIQTAEGIILKVTPFRDYDQILTIFTPDLGVIKVMLKNKGGNTKSGKKVCTPLSRMEVAYREGNSEIFSCYGIHQIESFLPLRSSFTFLEVGCDLLQVVLESQFLGKKAPDLYALLNFYLLRIPKVDNPWILSTSFRLKVLKHEGLCSFPLRCSICGEVLSEAAFIKEGEGRCSNHQQPGTGYWNSTELHTISRLAESQSFQELSLLNLSLKLQREVIVFFQSHYF